MVASEKHIVLIHGAGVKPDATSYQNIWLDALRSGIKRDTPKLVKAFDSATIDFVYYGDLTNGLVDQDWDPVIDIEDRKIALGALRSLKKPKLFKRQGYDELPHQSPLKEFAADVVAPITHGLGLGKLIKGKVVPELGAYWEDRDGFASNVDERVEQVLAPALKSDKNLLVVSHCLGSIATYNALWRLSQEPGAASEKCNLWLTLGSPLADETVKSQLAGWREAKPIRYPKNLVRWLNLAAEDDFHCHDETVMNDFNSMLTQHNIAEIVDHKIYNLSVRFGRSDPHHSSGYLIHPRTSKVVGEWLAQD